MKKLFRITTVPISLDILLGEQLRFMNQYYEVTAISADENELERIAKKYGVKCHAVEMTRTISPRKDLIAVWKLYRFLKKEKPHIVHTHTPKAGIVGMMAAWLAGVPNRFHTVAGLPLMEREGSKRRLLNLIEKLTYYFATNVYPNSLELNKIILKSKFCNAQKLKVIGKGSSNGINTTYFHKDQISLAEQIELKSHLGIKDKDFVFVFVGRLVKDKGINELVAAFKALSVKSVTTENCFAKTPKLLLVGPLEEKLDPLKAETLAEIEQNDQIISVGFQEEVRPYFAISDALVFPSYREGFPNVVLQSLAMEVPAIVTDINGCNEIVTHKQNGLCIPPKDKDSLHSAMELLITDFQLYNTLKNASRESIQPYEQHLIWDAILAEYQSASGE